ncbi:hypothetical protein [Nocardioides piscis]|uniref:Uncharacterized protein n=1 Tax=Nocardioides piscis TaxID=2714938 RepID=A0A6G7YJ41_9ACTN|nr:hypothetical protein [Nocardioides piscis]QIK76763.1 hypothetical protein G7071_16365 [Nocardioides piscis]
MLAHPPSPYVAAIDPCLGLLRTVLEPWEVAQIEVATRLVWGSTTTPMDRRGGREAPGEIGQDRADGTAASLRPKVLVVAAALALAAGVLRRHPRFSAAPR